MKNFLKLFQQIIKFNESRKVIINRVIPNFDFLFTKYEKTVSHHHSNSFMTFAFDAEWQKFKKY